MDKDAYGNTALTLACRHKDGSAEDTVAAVEVLLRASQEAKCLEALITFQQESTLETCLHWAARSGIPKLVRLLLTYCSRSKVTSAFICCKNALNQTALDVAGSKFQLSCEQMASGRAQEDQVGAGGRAQSGATGGAGCR